MVSKDRKSYFLDFIVRRVVEEGTDVWLVCKFHSRRWRGCSFPLLGIGGETRFKREQGERMEVGGLKRLEKD